MADPLAGFNPKPNPNPDPFKTQAFAKYVCGRRWRVCAAADAGRGTTCAREGRADVRSLREPQKLAAAALASIHEPPCQHPLAHFSADPAGPFRTT